MKENEKDLQELMQDMVHENNPKELIWAFGFKMVNGQKKPLKSLGQLYKEVSDNGGGAKLGVFDLITLVKETGDYRPIYKMLDELGLMALPQCGAPDGKNYHHEVTQMVNAFASIVQEASKANPCELALYEANSHQQKEFQDVMTRIKKGETA